MRIRVWDLPTRLFHWTLACLVIASIVTIKIGGNWVEWHFRCGYAILTLLLFRIMWGLWGSRYARFTQFVAHPRQIARYVRGLRSTEIEERPGHNPLGGLSVLAMLAALLFQATSGLFSNDDIASEGPLAARISKQASDWISDLHSANATVIYVLLGLHVLAIGYYLAVKRRNLVVPMITGSALAPPSAAVGSEPWIAIRDDWRTRLAAAVLLAACAAIVWLVVIRPSSLVGR